MWSACGVWRQDKLSGPLYLKVCQKHCAFLVLCCVCMRLTAPRHPVTPSPRHPVTAASTSVLSVSFSPSGAHLVVGCERGLIKVYTNSDFKLLFELQEQKVRSADYEDVQVVYTHAYLSPPPPPPQGYITCLAYSEDGEWLASGSSDGSLCLWRGESL